MHISHDKPHFFETTGKAYLACAGRNRTGISRHIPLDAHIMNPAVTAEKWDRPGRKDRWKSLARRASKRNLTEKKKVSKH